MADEQDLWQALVTLTTRLPTALDSVLQREHSILHFEYRVLTVLAASPHYTLRLKALAEQADSSQSRLSHVIRRLEDRGLLIRVGKGRSGIDAVLTPAGVKMVREVTPTVEALARELVLNALQPNEIQRLRALLQTVAEHFCEALNLSQDGHPQTADLLIA
jgi:DNA-binding MarR family transcriptional regulator